MYFGVPQLQANPDDGCTVEGGTEHSDAESILEHGERQTAPTDVAVALQSDDHCDEKGDTHDECDCRPKEGECRAESIAYTYSHHENVSTEDDSW